MNRISKSGQQWGIRMQNTNSNPSALLCISFLVREVKISNLGHPFGGSKYDPDHKVLKNTGDHDNQFEI